MGKNQKLLICDRCKEKKKKLRPVGKRMLCSSCEEKFMHGIGRLDIDYEIQLRKMWGLHEG